MKSFFNNIIDLFYPRVCEACGNSLMHNEDTVCMTCRYLLPKTGYEMSENNPLAQMFYGLVDFNAVTAEFFFSKSGRIQNLVHGLKYNGCKAAGFFLGEELGKSISKSPFFTDIDCLVPVPLHKKKEFKRGYNQSFVIAQGVEKITGIPIIDNVLFRKTYTETQTKKNKEERWENVKDVFEVKNAESLYGKHLLLIDDVLTTGATLIAAGTTLREISNVCISVATTACAGN